MKKRKLMISWALLLAILLNMFFPLGTAYAASDKGVLTDFKSKITQNGVEIGEGGTLTSGDPILVEISFGVPVEGDEPMPPAPVKKGDTVEIPLSSAFKVLSSSPIELKMGSLLVGHASFITDPDTNMVKAIVNFDGDDSVFDGTSHSVTCRFSGNFVYDSSGASGSSGNHTVIILEKTYTVNVPVLPIEYDVIKTGTANLANQTIEWTVKVDAKQGDLGINLGGYEFFDDLKAVGTYIPSSFKVDGTEVSPDTTGDALRYVFGDGEASPKTITFKTKIPDSAYYATSGQTVVNKAQLLNSDSKVVEEGSYEVKFTPKWIEKSGVSSDTGSTGEYNPNNRTITWSITANHMGVALNNVVITDVLVPGLTFKSAKWQAWTGSAWGAENKITPNANSEYAIGNINSKILLTIVTSVPDQEYTVGKTTYSNSANIRWDGLSGTRPGTGNIGVSIGYNAITKSGVADTVNQKIRWTVNVDTKKQSIPDLKVYDLLVYGDSINLSTVTGIPSGIKSTDLTPQYGQKYAGNFSGPYTVKVIPVMQGDKRVADLLEISSLSMTVLNTFSFDSQVVDPNIFAGNKTSTMRNTATLFSANAKLNAATGSVNYTNRMLLKSMLKRSAMLDPAAGVNSSITKNALESFDYKDKSVIFRLNVNADGIDLNNKINAEGQTLGAVTLTDTLPEGWEFDDLAPGTKYLIFEGIGKTDGSVLAKDTTPDTVLGLDASFSGRTATFIFDSMNQPYVILVKARPTSDTAAGYFDSNQTITERNNISLKAKNWAAGVSSYQDVTVISQILGKNTTQIKAGELKWTVDYKPYELPQLGDRLEDKLPIGIDLRMDARGNLVLTGNITAYEMVLNADGSYTIGDSIVLKLGENVRYENNTRTLSFIFPDNTKAYRFSYITDVTGEPGNVTNQVSLIGDGKEQEGTSKSYVISASDGSASLLRNGWIKISKINEGGIPLIGAEYTLYAIDGCTVIKKGITDSNGILRLKAIPDGEYLLKETVAPAGYTLENVAHSLLVKTEGLTVTSSIDGKVGANANVITIKNYLEGTAGNLTINKVVVGEGADTTKSFDFMLTLDGATGDYPYIGHGVPSGTITSGDTISLAHGQSITIVGLPKGATYKVTEEDYSYDGYTSTSIGEEGTIVADATQVASFTNTREIGNLTISKTVSGNAGDNKKKFDFMLTLEGAADISYDYTGNGVPDGAIKSGDTISLAHGQSITIVGLPKGATYKVTEEDYSHDGYKLTSIGDKGTIVAKATQTASFINTKNIWHPSPITGSLTIIKNVTGKGADYTKKFNFIVKLIGTSHSYSYTGTYNGTIKSGGTISLAHGESITIDGLPEGLEYIIEEDDYTKDGYISFSEGAKGVIVTDDLQIASFTNERKGDPGEPVIPGKPDDNTGSGGVIKEPTDAQGNNNIGGKGLPKTGDSHMRGLAMQGLIYFSIALMILIMSELILNKRYFRQRKKK